MLLEITRVANQLTATLTSTSIAVSHQSSGDLNSAPALVNLPKLHLPTYDGSVLKWSEFWDIFKASLYTGKIFLRCRNLVILKEPSKVQLMWPSLEFLLLKIITMLW